MKYEHKSRWSSTEKTTQRLRVITELHRRNNKHRSRRSSKEDTTGTAGTWQYHKDFIYSMWLKPVYIILIWIRRLTPRQSYVAAGYCCLLLTIYFISSKFRVAQLPDLTVILSIKEIDCQSDCKPDEQPQPVFFRKRKH